MKKIIAWNKLIVLILNVHLINLTSLKIIMGEKKKSVTNNSINYLIYFLLISFLGYRGHI